MSSCFRASRRYAVVYVFFITTYILPDKGQYDNWMSEAKKYQVKGLGLDFIEKMEVKRNTDLADLLLSENSEDYVKNFVECLSTDQ